MQQQPVGPGALVLAPAPDDRVAADLRRQLGQLVRIHWLRQRDQLPGREAPGDHLQLIRTIPAEGRASAAASAGVRGAGSATTPSRNPAAMVVSRRPPQCGHLAAAGATASVVSRWVRGMAVLRVSRLRVSRLWVSRLGCRCGAGRCERCARWPPRIERPVDPSPPGWRDAFPRRPGASGHGRRGARSGRPGPSQRRAAQRSALDREGDRASPRDDRPRHRRPSALPGAARPLSAHPTPADPPPDHPSRRPPRSTGQSRVGGAGASRARVRWLVAEARRGWLRGVRRRSAQGDLAAGCSSRQPLRARRRWRRGVCVHPTPWSNSSSTPPPTARFHTSTSATRQVAGVPRYQANVCWLRARTRTTTTSSSLAAGSGGARAAAGRPARSARRCAHLTSEGLRCCTAYIEPGPSRVVGVRRCRQW